MASAPDSLCPAFERFGGVARRVCWKDELRGIEVDELLQEAQSPAPDHALAESEIADQVERAIQPIAQLLGWTDAKTGNLLYRGLADMRERLLAEGVQWNTRT
jgi:hypothetical protein